MKTIAYISGTRADFGLMTAVLDAIRKSKKLKLDLYATGMHLMPEFGRTIREVKRHIPNVRILRAAVSGDQPHAAAEFIGKLITLLSGALRTRRPDLMLLLGDRAEMLAAASVCVYMGIPIAHIHGGERTTTVDDTVRHAITKLSTLHFAATKASARYIRSMGEDARRIHTVGAPGLDVLRATPIPKKQMGHDFILLTLHPISESYREAGKQMATVLRALKSLRKPVIAIYPNADGGGRAMAAVLERERANPLFEIHRSVSHERFLLLEQQAAVWIGNSSAMMIESPFFGTPVINVGPRQRGRERGNNVIDVAYDTGEIVAAVKQAMKRGRRTGKNPWGDGHTAQKIVSILESLDYENLGKTNN